MLWWEGDLKLEAVDQVRAYKQETVVWSRQFFSIVMTYWYAQKY